jgi:G protein-coupled receptor Mth (Methuselah protein)
LFLFPDGKLGHYIRKQAASDDDDYDEDMNEIERLLTERSTEFLYHDFEQGHYCLDKTIFPNKTTETYTFAYVCSPGKVINWTDTDFLLRKILNPLFHGLSMIMLLIVAIIYFILPTLRDLVGNIVTTITICLIISQAADLVRIFTEFSNHFSFMIADAVLYASLLGAFFWLNSMGYYIWKTFKSRNVFLRVTDGRKYCFYSGYSWGMTLLLTALAIFAHFFLDTGTIKKQYIFEDQETIGWLGIAVFFTPIAFTIIINLFFYVTTLKVMNRINSYGRIHNKLKNK